MEKYRIIEKNGTFAPQYCNIHFMQWLSFGAIFKSYSDAVDFLDKQTSQKTEIIIHEYDPENNDN